MMIVALLYQLNPSWVQNERTWNRMLSVRVNDSTRSLNCRRAIRVSWWWHLTQFKLICSTTKGCFCVLPNTTSTLLGKAPSRHGRNAILDFFIKNRKSISIQIPTFRFDVISKAAVAITPQVVWTLECVEMPLQVIDSRRNILLHF